MLNTGMQHRNFCLQQSHILKTALVMVTQTKKPFFCTKFSTEQKFWSGLQTLKTQEINAYYHPIVVWEKHKCPPKESAVPPLTSRLNEAFLRLWCVTRHTILKESVMAELKYLLQRSLKFLKNLAAKKKLSNGKISISSKV